MRKINIEQFAKICQGDLSYADGTALITGFALDHREVKPGNVFLAIKGAKVDGRSFAKKALEAGAVAVLSECLIEGPHIKVPSLVEALAEFGRRIRKDFVGPVIGITGSNGKTSTKEFTATTLSPLGPVLKSEGNKNTEYTSPLLWADLEDNHQAVVVEFAMRGFRQIRHLASISCPTIGVITMIGNAHLEMVGSREGIMKAKAEIFDYLPADGTAILWAEDDYRNDLVKRAPCPVRTFGLGEEAECRILCYKALDWNRCQIRGILDGQSFESELPIIGRHQALNAAAAILVAHTLGVDIQRAAEKLSCAKFPPLRMEIKKYKGATILLDTYNASPDSTVAAIRTFAELPARGRKFFVFGTMVELGDVLESGYRRVGTALGEYPPDGVILLNGDSSLYTYNEALRAGYPSAWIQKNKTLEEITSFLKDLREGDVVLMKASRLVGLEKALEAGFSC